MYNAEYFEKRIFFGLFNIQNTIEERKKRVQVFTNNLDENYLNKYNKNIYCVVRRYFKLTKNLISYEDFLSAIRAVDVDEATVMEYQAILLEYFFGEPVINLETPPDGSRGRITDSEFIYAINKFKEQIHTDNYGVLLSDTMQILNEGKSVEGKFLKGVEEAVNFYNLNHMAFNSVEYPENDIQDEIDDIKSEYAGAKHGENSTFSVMTGIREIDQLTGGAKPGEMWFIAAYSGEGKTTQCINMTYQAMLQGKNTVYLTAETLRKQVRRRLISRHSKHPKFNYPQGLPADKLKKGTLTKDEEIIFHNVVDDLTNPSYGKYKIVQLPKKCTVEYVTSVLTRYEYEFYVHAVVWDELRLAGSRKRQTQREELNDIITSSKVMCVTHLHKDETNGFWLLAPYQINRTSWKNAQESGRYDKSCMAESGESERSADLIMSQLVDQQNPNIIKTQILKYRDGNDKGVYFNLDWQFDCCHISSQENQDTSLLNI